MAGIPTSASRVARAQTQSARLDVSLQRLRSTSVTWKASLAAGPKNIDDIISGLFALFLDEKAVLNEAKDTGGALDAYAGDLFLKVEAFDGDVSPANDRIDLAHPFLKASPIRINPVGDSVLPSPLVADTNYWATAIAAGFFSFASSLVNANADTKITLTTAGTGQFVIRWRLLADINKVLTELDDVLDWIQTNVPQTTTTLEVRGHTLDKTAASGDAGVVQKTMTSGDTSGLQTALQALIDEIEAPA